MSMRLGMARAVLRAAAGGKTGPSAVAEGGGRGVCLPAAAAAALPPALLAVGAHAPPGGLAAARSLLQLPAAAAPLALAPLGGDFRRGFAASAAATPDGDGDGDGPPSYQEQMEATRAAYRRHWATTLQGVKNEDLPMDHPRRPRKLGGTKGVSLTSRCQKSPAPSAGEGWRGYDADYQGVQQLKRLPVGYMDGYPNKNRNARRRAIMKRLFIQLEREKKAAQMKVAEAKKHEEKLKRWAERRKMRLVWMQRVADGLPMPKGFNANKYLRDLSLPESTGGA